ncbi:MAG: glycosyltransferase family protein [Deltaproteobacteria bacterium]|nr:glycosyltransferase family protein [Deltaproteobacteria bacterium]
MRTVAIVQARMGSSRLPGKVLADLGGDTMLARVVERLRAARRIAAIAIATSTHAGDDAIVREAERLGAVAYRGSEGDVLARYLGAARATQADAVVRVTSDCPLLDPGVVDEVVAALGDDVDYASNTHARTYPRGLDVEALHRDTLERIARLGTSPAAREHVTAFVLERPDLFCTRQVCAPSSSGLPIDDSDLRWTVDTPEDLALVRALYARFDLAREAMPYRALVAAMRAHPELAILNAHVAQKPTFGEEAGRAP